MRLAPGPKLWYLQTTSWVGISAGARHTYVRLEPGGAGPRGEDHFDRLRVERQLTTEDAADLNDKQAYLTFRFTWKAGDFITGFDSEAEAIAAGLCVFRALMAEGDSLALNDWSDRETLIAGPEGNEHEYATRFGPGCLGRTLDARVERDGAGGWRFLEVEE